jgi:hypothetical protein
MSAVMELLIARTLVLACVMEQGRLAEQVVPEPLGEA